MADIVEKTASNEVIVFPSHALIAAYLNKIKSIERENLKNELMRLSMKLSDDNIIVPLDFQPYGDGLYSEIFDRDMMFLFSAGVIREKKGSIIYEITEKGEKLIKERDLIYKNIPPVAIEKVETLLANLSNDEI